VQKLMTGVKTSIPQNSIGHGTTYYTRQWGLKQKFDLIKNFRMFKKEINSPSYHQRRKQVKLIDTVSII